MKIVRNAILRENKRMPIAMICIAVIMLLLTLCNITIDFTGETTAVAIEFMNTWALALSVIPVTWGVCVAMLMKTKKVTYSKLPAYIICCMVLLALILFVIAVGEAYFVYKVLALAVAVLLVYPFVIATLTIEGRMYNRVFATIFSGILLIISVVAAIVVCVTLKCIMFSALIPALVYTELILNVLCYDLVKPENKAENKKTVVTH